METKMIEKINLLLEIARDNFKQTGWSKSHELKMARIDGMIEMLSMVTGKEYVITSDGFLKER